MESSQTYPSHKVNHLRIQVTIFMVGLEVTYMASLKIADLSLRTEVTSHG